MFKKIQEGNADVFVPQEQKVSKKLEVFYNPVMKVNRDMSVLVLKAWDKTEINACLPLAGTGIRACRFLKELPQDKLANLHVNDYDEKAADIIKKNIDKNNNTNTNIKITQKEANVCLYNEKGYDHIDIDPFGTPNPFLDTAIKRIKHNGILAITATDTSALSGTYENPGKRKYWAKGIRNYLMHEIGMRILIRKIQLIAVQYEKALTPIIGYTHEHYMKIFFSCEKGKKKCDEVQKEHLYFLYCKKCTHRKVSKYNIEKCQCGNEYLFYGPIYSGKLWNSDFLSEMIKQVDENISQETINLLHTLKSESEIDQIGFYEPGGQSKHLSTKNWNKFEKIQEKLAKLNYKFAITHFQKGAFKTDAPFDKIIKIMYDK